MHAEVGKLAAVARTFDAAEGPTADEMARQAGALQAVIALLGGDSGVGDATRTAAARRAATPGKPHTAHARLQDLPSPLPARRINGRAAGEEDGAFRSF